MFSETPVHSPTMSLGLGEDRDSAICDDNGPNLSPEKCEWATDPEPQTEMNTKQNNVGYLHLM